MNVAAALAEAGIRLRNIASGQHYTTCPRCSPQRRNKTAPCLSVLIDENGVTWNCHHCGWKREPRGEQQRTERGYGPRPRANGAAGHHVTAPSAYDPRPEPPPPEPLEAPAPPAYQAAAAPAQSREEPPPAPVDTSRWLPLTPGGVAHFAKRGISAETLRRAGVQWARVWIPAKQAEAPAFCFPYIRPGGAVVNAKYRTADKEFAQHKGGEKIYFGLDRLDPADDAVVIVEGEIDALSLLEAGYLNVLSVPAGAPKQVKEGPVDPEHDKAFSYVWNCRAELQGFKKIVLACDADAPGQALMEELARRYSRERCWIVRWPDGIKDANDALQRCGPAGLMELVERAKPYPIENLYLASSFHDQVMALYRGGRRPGLSLGWRGFDPATHKRDDQAVLTVREGELWIVTGVPGAGKSEFLDAILVNLAEKHGHASAICSLENPPDDHIAKLVEKRTWKPFHPGPTARMTVEELAGAEQWLERHVVWILPNDQAPSIDWILEKARAAVMQHGIRYLVIDPYNQLEQLRGKYETETQFVAKMLGKVKRFAKAHGTTVFFVAHPAKPFRMKDGSYPPLSLYDVSGGANWANIADVGVVIERNYEPGSRDVKIRVVKVRFKATGRIGEVKLLYDRVSGRYSDPPYDDNTGEVFD